MHPAILLSILAVAAADTQRAGPRTLHTRDIVDDRTPVPRARNYAHDRRLLARDPQLGAVVGVAAQVGRIAAEQGAAKGAEAGAQQAVKQGAKAAKDAPKKATEKAPQQNNQGIPPKPASAKPPPPGAKPPPFHPGDVNQRVHDRWKDPARKDHARAVGQEIVRGLDPPLLFSSYPALSAPACFLGHVPPCRAVC